MAAAFQRTPTYSQRPEARRDYWANIWGDLAIPLQFEGMAELRRKAWQELGNWPPLDIEEVRLSPKASGLDGLSVDMLRNGLREAVEVLVGIFHCMEATLEVPTQFQHHLVALLPKNLKAERPIALMSVLYRAWVKLR